MTDAQLIAAWLRRTGAIWSPISEMRTIECEHGNYGWEHCDDCTVIQIADAIEAGEWRDDMDC